MTGEKIKAFALQRAKALGFAAAGVAAAGLAPHAEAFRRWLAAGRHASMDYMTQNVEKRCDPRIEWPWARSVLCLAASYATGEADEPASAVARYARGRDYHKVLKRHCRRLADDLTELLPDLQTRICVDTAPIAERDWAAAAGLGWIGANGCVIHPTLGSYLMLAEILLSIDLPADEPIADRCGDCRECMEACPNGAFAARGVVDARRCNSWATIENRGDLDGDALDTRGSVFGCDICQQVCPHNRDLAPGQIGELLEPTPVGRTAAAAILGWSRQDWDEATRGSATRRASYEMFLRNAAVAAGGLRLAAAKEPLEKLTRHEASIVRRAAAWALDRLVGQKG